MTVSRDDDAPRRRPLRRDAVLNQERVLAAATATMLRHGRQVPMATIAAAAGVGVGTLYRRYPTREALLETLTERSFRLVLAAAEGAAERGRTALDAVDHFLDRTIAQRGELVLPLHNGPSELSPAARSTQAQVHATIGRLLSRGRGDGSVRGDVTAADIVVFGAMLAQPLSDVPDWDRLARRQKRLFLRGLAAAPLSRPRRPT